MNIWGINALNHDASIAVLSNGKLVYWKRSSEYSGIPGDDLLHHQQIYDAITAGQSKGPEIIAWYERPFVKKARQLYAGQYSACFEYETIPSVYLEKLNLGYAKVNYFSHHKSHAAAGFYTSPFNEAAVVVVDAIGEFECASIWHGEGLNLTKVWSVNYPSSLGLFYSAFTDLIGYKPVAEEYLLQKDSERGIWTRYYDDVSNYFETPMNLRYNLHKGVYNWPYEITTDQDRYDIAAAVQKVFEDQMGYIMSLAKRLTGSRNLVYMGGCAMNSKANEWLGVGWDGVWSLPVPGDASSAIGAALLQAETRIVWHGALAKQIQIKYNKDI